MIELDPKALDIAYKRFNREDPDLEEAIKDYVAALPTPTTPSRTRAPFDAGKVNPGDMVHVPYGKRRYVGMTSKGDVVLESLTGGVGLADPSAVRIEIPDPLGEALKNLIDHADLAEGSGFGTLATSFVKTVATEALKQVGELK